MPRFHLSTAGERWARLTALFLVVTGARFWLIQHYAVSLPLWDQWDGEGMNLIKPWLSGRLKLSSLFNPHNEHRIVLTRVLELALFVANGQWDGLVEMVVNAVLCGISAVCLAGAALAVFQGRFQRRILLAAVVCFVLPFGWENTLCGFQSQNYFRIFFSLLAVWGMSIHLPGSGRWWTGLLGAVLACLSMASGFLAVAAVLGILGLRAARERRFPPRGQCVAAILFLVIAAIGWTTRTEIPWHRELRAECPAAFVAAWCRFLAWPWCGSPWLGWVALVPSLLVAALYLRPSRRDPEESRSGEVSRDELLLAGSAWALLQTAALAYGRGGQGALPACRYMDLLAIVSLVNFLLWLVLLDRSRGGRWHGATKAAVLAWTLLLSGGLGAETVRDFRGWLPGYRDEFLRSEANVRGYVATGDFTRFLADKPMHDLPYPDPVRLAAFLDDPMLRSVLPADIRLPVRLQPPDGGDSRTFVPGGFDSAIGAPVAGASWGTYGAGVAVGASSFRASFASPVMLPYLRFSFAGHRDRSGLRVTLFDGVSGHQTSREPGRSKSQRWHDEHLATPGGRDLRLAIDGADAAHWFAFSEPVVVGGWSYWTGFLLRRSLIFLVSGLVLAGGLELLPLRRRVREPGAACALPADVVRTFGPARPSGGSLELFSVVVPARDEESSIVAMVEKLHAELRHAAVSHEIIVVDDGSTDGTWNLLCGLSARIPEVRPIRNTGPHGFGRAIIHGLDRMQGDAAAIMMADESDAPSDAVRYWKVLQEGSDCVFGSRFIRGGEAVGYPRMKLIVNRLANLFIQLLFAVPFNDTTNAFKAYRREVIEGCRPLISPHFNLTVELPLKAIVRGYRWTVVPITWRNRQGGSTKFKFKETGSRYLFICCYVWLEKHLSRGDYYRRPINGRAVPGR